MISEQTVWISQNYLTLTLADFNQKPVTYGNYKSIDIYENLHCKMIWHIRKTFVYINNKTETDKSKNAY